jgi:hypothetical protein
VAVIYTFALLDPEEVLKEAQAVVEGFNATLQLTFEVILNESLLPDDPFSVTLETSDLSSGIID